MNLPSTQRAVTTGDLVAPDRSSVPGPRLSEVGELIEVALMRDHLGHRTDSDWADCSCMHSRRPTDRSSTVAVGISFFATQFAATHCAEGYL
jgi:hypothetical protein